MSPQIATEAQGGAGRSALAAVAIAAIAIALVFVVRARPQVEPFDPRSNSSSGTRGLVLLLERQGADIEVGETVPAPGDRVRVLVLEDSLDDEQRRAVLDFVEAGGIAVVADPTSSLHGGPGVEGGSTVIDNEGAYDQSSPRDFIATVERGTCTIDALSHLRGLAVESGVSYPVGGEDRSCFGGVRSAFVFARPLGAGTVVAFGDNRIWTNRLLDHADNAGLATALLAPTDGASVTIVQGRGPRPAGVPEVGRGDDTLSDLVHPSVWMALAQLALAFVIFAIARGIRPGRVVDEPPAVPIAGSELVAATGNVMHRAGHRERAAELLRYDGHRRLSTAMRVPTTMPLDALDRAAVERIGTAPGEVGRLFTATAIPDDRALVDLHRSIHRLVRHAETDDRHDNDRHDNDRHDNDRHDNDRHDNESEPR